MLASMQNRPSKSALILFALCALCGRAAANDTRPDDYVARAREFLRALYPGLDGRLRPVIIGHRLRDPGFTSPDTMNFFTILLYDFELGPAGEPMKDVWCSDPTVSAQFIFDWQSENKELYDLNVRGPAIDGAAKEFAIEFGKHGEWSDAKIGAALNDARAKFGPDHKAEFLHAFPREQLKPFMGGDLEVVSAGFNFEHNAEMRLPPTWVVQAKWHAIDGRDSDCTLAFEPFHGYLTMIMLMPVVPKSGGQQNGKPGPKAP